MPKYEPKHPLERSYQMIRTYIKRRLDQGVSEDEAYRQIYEKMDSIPKSSGDAGFEELRSWAESV